jgi:hypothetical protein
MEWSVDFADRQILCDVKGVRHIGCVENEVELELERFSPVVFVVGDEVFGAELEGVVLLMR